MRTIPHRAFVDGHVWCLRRRLRSSHLARLSRTSDKRPQAAWVASMPPPMVCMDASYSWPRLLARSPSPARKSTPAGQTMTCMRMQLSSIVPCDLQGGPPSVSHPLIMAHQMSCIPSQSGLTVVEAFNTLMPAIDRTACVLRCLHNRRAPARRLHPSYVWPCPFRHGALLRWLMFTKVAVSAILDV